MIMEARSPDLQSTGWRPSSWLSSSPRLEASETGQPVVYSSLSLSHKAGEDQCPSSKTVRQEEQVLYSPSVLFSPGLKGLDEAHGCGEGNLLYCLPIQVLITSRNTFTDIPRVMFNQISGHPLGPVKMTCKVNHHMS